MMGGDSSIYSGNGVGDRRMACRKGETTRGAEAPQEMSLRALIVFLLGFLFLLSALSTKRKACERPPIQGLRANGLLWPLMTR